MAYPVSDDDDSPIEVDPGRSNEQEPGGHDRVDHKEDNEHFGPLFIGQMMR